MMMANICDKLGFFHTGGRLIETWLLYKKKQLRTLYKNNSGLNNKMSVDNIIINIFDRLGMRRRMKKY